MNTKKFMTGLMSIYRRGADRPAVFLATVGGRYLYEYRMPGHETWLVEIELCRKCNGTGLVDGQQCIESKCWGAGYRSLRGINYLAIPDEWKRAIIQAGALDKMLWNGRGEPGALSTAWNDLINFEE